MRLTHSRAVWLMVLVALLWSIAGVVSRHLEAARSFEVNFWRSAFTVLAIAVALVVLNAAGRAGANGGDANVPTGRPGGRPGAAARLRRGARAVWRDILRGGWPLGLSSLCWAVMFTNFMVALMLTTVATVLITLSIAPLITALFSRLFLYHRLPRRTWLAMAVAGAGIAWMFGRQALDASASLGGALVALAVPFAAATNWTLLQHLHQRHARDPAVSEPEMLPAVMVGALLSALLTLPLAWPFAATAHDLALLALLGVVQLAIPCLLVVRLSRVLPGPEISLIGLLEVVFGVLLAWVGADEVPGPAARAGGTLVIAALLANEWLALRERRAAGPGLRGAR